MHPFPNNRIYVSLFPWEYVYPFSFDRIYIPFSLKYYKCMHFPVDSPFPLTDPVSLFLWQTMHAFSSDILSISFPLKDYMHHFSFDRLWISFLLTEYAFLFFWKTIHPFPSERICTHFPLTEYKSLFLYQIINACIFLSKTMNLFSYDRLHLFSSDRLHLFSSDRLHLFSSDRLHLFSYDRLCMPFPMTDYTSWKWCFFKDFFSPALQHGITLAWLVLPHLRCDAIPQPDFIPILFPISVQF